MLEELQINILTPEVNNCNMSLSTGTAVERILSDSTYNRKEHWGGWGEKGDKH